jgi:hypothetical protein
LQDLTNSLKLFFDRPDEENRIISIQRGSHPIRLAGESRKQTIIYIHRNEPLQGLHSEDEEEREQGVPLSQAAEVTDAVASHTVKEDPRGGCGEEQRNPVTPALTKTTGSKHVQEVDPGNAVEGFRNVELDQQGGSFGAVQTTDLPLDE